jgi:alkanesulfonate monooxygenase SsuD/methylene tetrahydromethanopterin reductase-like flavin-dependent oxidoreductase (luciferase family)
VSAAADRAGSQFGAEDCGFACSGALAASEIADTAAEAEALGYTSLWITVLRGITDPAAVLEAALGASRRLEVGLGLVPLDSFPGAELAEQLAGAPTRALISLGVGMRHIGAASFWHAQAADFRAGAPGVRIAVGSYGPLVLRAGGALADTVLLNWMTPERVRWALEQVDAGALAAGRERPPRPAYVYVPTAVGKDAPTQLAGALHAMARFDYHRRHQAALSPDAALGVAVDLATAEPPQRPSYGPDTVPVVNPTGETTRVQRDALMRALAPARAV